MANKFTKSVLERQAKELRDQSKPIPKPEPKPDLEPKSEPIPEQKPEPNPEPSIRTKAKAKPKSEAGVDLREFLENGGVRAAKNKTFYLDEAVIEGLHRAARAQNVTDSRLLNEILKKLLEIG